MAAHLVWDQRVLCSSHSTPTFEDVMGQFYSAGIYRIDFFSLLACMMVGHLLVDNPFYGAALYLFADIIKSRFQCRLSAFSHGRWQRYTEEAFTFLALAGGVAVAFVYPSLVSMPEAGYVSVFVLALVLRDIPDIRIRAFAGAGKRVYSVVLPLASHLVFDAAALLAVCSRMPQMEFYAVSALVLLTGGLKLFSPEKRVSGGLPQRESRYQEIASYRLFSRMTLYSTISLNLGVLVLFLISMQKFGEYGFRPMGYLGIFLLLAAIRLVLELSTCLLKRRMRGLGLAEFIAGALTWGAGGVLMFNAGSILWSIVWAMVWGLGIAMISSAIRKFEYDFAAVGKLAGDEYGHKELELANTMVATAASMVSSSVMLILMALYSFALPAMDYEFPTRLNVWVAQIPLVFMAVAFVLALRQPLDSRNREKLMLYIRSVSGNDRTRESLQNMFVRKYRMRFGVKVMCTLARPFLRLGVSGKENLRPERYPSVFVCNHGFIYGPVSAVIYLPTYFRPWIHNVMLDPVLAERELNKSMHGVVRVLGRKAGGWLLHKVTRLVCWALNSFNPVPVVRGASRDVMSTFRTSLDALLDGDNILIFPEKPRELAAGTADDAEYDAYNLRSFYTGFAHLGKMYHDATGKNLLFYPLYSDKRRRLFKIGTAIEYDSTLEPRESKLRLSASLQEKMETLSRE